MVHGLLDQVLVYRLYLIWNNLLVLSAAVHVVGSLLYLVKGSDQLQEWAIPREKTIKTMDQKESQH